MLELAQKLSSLKGERYKGAEIAEVLWHRDSPESIPEPLRILSDRHGLLVVEVRGSEEVLKVTLLLRQPGQQSPAASMPNPPRIPEEEMPNDIWHAFSKEEISVFVEKARDTNPLHQGMRPVVPGLLLLQRLLDETAFHGCARILLRFRHPAFAEEPLRLVSHANGNFQIFSPREILCEGCVATCR